MSTTITEKEERRREIESAMWDAYEAGQASLYADTFFFRRSKKKPDVEPIAGYWLAVGNHIAKALESFKAQNFIR